MSSKIVERPAYLKRAVFKYGNRKNPPAPPPLEEMLKKVKRGTRGWQERHHPKRPNGAAVEQGTQCAYLNDVSVRSKAKGDGVYFTIGSYVYGKGEHQIALNMDTDEPDVVSGPIYDNKGNQRSIVHEFHCVALGETLIVQNERGGGGLPVLCKLLTYLFRQHVDADLPSLHLVDVLSDELRNLIISEGGISAMRLKMVAPSVPSPSAKIAAISQPMYAAINAVPGAHEITALFEASEGKPIDIDVAINAYESVEDGGSELDKVQLKTAKGGWMNLGRYRAKGNLRITVDAHGIEHKSDFKPELFAYLDEIREETGDDRWRLVNDEGYFIAGKILSVGKS